MFVRSPRQARLGRRYSLRVMNFGLAYCAIELIATTMSKHDFIPLGVIPFVQGPPAGRPPGRGRHPHQQDGPALNCVSDQMPEPKYVISPGSCSNC